MSRVDTAAGRTSLPARFLAHAGGRLAGTEPMNLFLVLGKHPALFRAWLHFARRLMPFGRLPRRDAELVILRIAHRRANAYERGQHERIGRRAGLSPAQIDATRDDPATADWSPRQRTILVATDQLHDQRDIDDSVWTELEQHLDERERIELVLLAGHYEMLATAITALRITVESPR